MVYGVYWCKLIPIGIYQMVPYDDYSSKTRSERLIMLLTIQDLLAQASSNLKCLPAEQALDNCKAQNGTLIDVREPNEVAEKPVKGAINIPRGVLEMQALQKFPDENHPLFLHCASSVRAKLAAEQLQRLGYKDVTVLTCMVDDLQKLTNLD
jgi:rhodanese-related sulfurtransferase